MFWYTESEQNSFQFFSRSWSRLIQYYVIVQRCRSISWSNKLKKRTMSQFIFLCLIYFTGTNTSSLFIIRIKSWNIIKVFPSIFKNTSQGALVRLYCRLFWQFTFFKPLEEPAFCWLTEYRLLLLTTYKKGRKQNWGSS